MEPALSNRDRIAVSRVLVWIGKYSRGDTVICRYALDGNEDYIVKRIIGVPGDLLVIHDGSVYVNGVALYEGYLLNNYTSGEIEMELADDEYFIMGDNRSISTDSRYSGPIKAKNVIGRVVLRWYPFDKISINY